MRCLSSLKGVPITLSAPPRCKCAMASMAFSNGVGCESVNLIHLEGLNSGSKSYKKPLSVQTK